MSLTLDLYTNQATGESMARLTFSVSMTIVEEDGAKAEQKLREQLLAKAQVELNNLRTATSPSRRIYEHGIAL